MVGDHPACNGPWEGVARPSHTTRTRGPGQAGGVGSRSHEREAVGGESRIEAPQAALTRREDHSAGGCLTCVSRARGPWRSWTSIPGACAAPSMRLGRQLTCCRRCCTCCLSLSPNWTLQCLRLRCAWVSFARFGSVAFRHQRNGIAHRQRQARSPGGSQRRPVSPWQGRGVYVCTELLFGVSSLARERPASQNSPVGGPRIQLRGERAWSWMNTALHLAWQRSVSASLAGARTSVPNGRIVDATRTAWHVSALSILLITVTCCAPRTTCCEDLDMHVLCHCTVQRDRT